ncbi:Pentatricopeptide repeat, partial [Thalictrum thalictroides]
VFEDVRKEYWYKPQLLLYANMIHMLANNNLLEKVDLLLFYLKIEMLRLDADINTEGFNVLLQTLMDYSFTTHAMECFQLMKEVKCDLNEATFKILVIGLESKGETGLSSMLRQEAQKYIGWPLECLEQKEEMS